MIYILHRVIKCLKLIFCHFLSLSLSLALLEALSDAEGDRPLAEWQVKELEVTFSTSGYPDLNTITKLARSLELPKSQIQVCVFVGVCVCDMCCA